ncbi:MAG: MFS transporter [Anaerolineae bacterium]|nr:MFS transporter [Gloeobacterales cyanobacterium ES-bin-313]
MLSLTRYQWTVLFAAWLGWGFDIFDSLLFNFVAPNCVPTLLGLAIGSPEAKSATFFWTGLLTSLLLLGWAVGGILFGAVADRIGRTKTLLITIIVYALGTASCAFAPNIWVLIVCRLFTSLGIGGEWAAGATMVAEVVPEKSRIEAGAILYTSAPIGLLLATFLNFQVAGSLLKSSPETSWRYVFLFGLLPAFAAFVVRFLIKEPEKWEQSDQSKPPTIAELFSPENRPLTISGLLMAMTALLTWWSCNAFIPIVATGLAQVEATTRNLVAADKQGLIEAWKALASNSFNLGGLIGTLFTVPAAKFLGRRAMFATYFLLSGLAVLATFGLDLPPVTRLYLYFPIGLTVFGVFGSFTYYLPELFPTRLRATGAGFCYNVGRVIAAGGPFLVGSIASQGNLQLALNTLFYVGFIPLVGLCFLPLVIETRGQVLAD